ncbi:MAG: lysoplasmalogenase [Acidimicrobiia bacterium]|nr:lysoplasmalogenase [Acidimicrobiia bacterium]
MTIALITAVAVLVGITLYAERSRARWRVWPKAAASAGFIAVAVDAGGFDSRYGRWVLLALALGWIGDVALALDRSIWFVVGLGAFLLSHLAYVGSFQAHGLRAIAAAVTLVLLSIAAASVGRWLLPHVTRGLRVPVIAYLMVITVMVAGATGAASDGAPWPVLPAAVLFAISDLTVARHQFVAPGFVNRAIGLPMYYAAQVLFALSVGMI